MARITAHFSEEEMRCPCCGLCQMNKKFMDELERFRQMVDFPIRVISGMRCPQDNSFFVPSSPQSCHLEGKAADLRWTRDKFMMLRIALATFDGVGISKSFLHVDLGGIRKFWIY